MKSPKVFKKGTRVIVVAGAGASRLRGKHGTVIGTETRQLQEYPRPVKIYRVQLDDPRYGPFTFTRRMLKREVKP